MGYLSSIQKVPSSVPSMGRGQANFGYGILTWSFQVSGISQEQRKRLLPDHGTAELGKILPAASLWRISVSGGLGTENSEWDRNIAFGSRADTL